MIVHWRHSIPINKTFFQVQDIRVIRQRDLHVVYILLHLIHFNVRLKICLFYPRCLPLLPIYRKGRRAHRIQCNLYSDEHDELSRVI